MTTITQVSTAVVQANFDYTFVRVTCDNGAFGTGEAFFAPGGSAAIRDLGSILIGRDPRPMRVLVERLFRAVGGTASLGTAYHAVSGLETALWDLNGKLADRPIVDLLGGRHRDSVAVYADLHGGSELASLDNVLRYRVPFWSSPDGQTHTGTSYWEAAEEDANTTGQALERARVAVKAGFRRLKFDLDVFGVERELSDRSMSRTALDQIQANAADLREAVGPAVEIAFDCHWRFDIPSSLAVAEAVAPVSPMWLEDPVPPSPKAHAVVAARSPVPIATGENVYLLDGFADLIDHNAAHIITPDVQKTGGLAETLRIADLAARHFIPVAPHCIASPLGFMASAHVSAAMSNFMCLEFHGTDVPFWGDLVVGGREIIDDGRCLIPDAPGVGVELDLEVVRAYAAPGEPVFGEEPVR